MELRRYVAKGSPAAQMQEARLDAGSGMEGDYHKNVSLLTKVALLWSEGLAAPGLCFEKQKMNILLDGGLTHGSQLSFSEAILHVRAEQKYCFPACVYRQDATACPLAEGMFFADVLQGGIVRLGEIGVVTAMPLELSVNPTTPLD